MALRITKLSALLALWLGIMALLCQERGPASRKKSGRLHVHYL